MTDIVAISDLPSADALTGAESFALVQAGETRKAALTAISLLVQGLVQAALNSEISARITADALKLDKSSVASGAEAVAGSVTDKWVNPVSLKAAIDAAVAGLLASAPGALNTLNELAAALGNDPNFATTITNALALKASITALTTESDARIAADVVEQARALAAEALKLDKSAVASDAEAIAGSLTTKWINPASLKAAIGSAVTGLISGAPGALDTLNELSAALGNDANFATTVTNALALKASIASLTVETNARTDADALKLDKSSVASDAEAIAGSLTNKWVPPRALRAAIDTIAEARATVAGGVSKTDGFSGELEHTSADGRTTDTFGYRLSDIPSDRPGPVAGDYTPWRDRAGSEGHALSDGLRGVWDDRRPGIGSVGGLIMKTLPSNGGYEITTPDGGRMLYAPHVVQVFSQAEIDAVNLKLLALRSSVLTPAASSRLESLDADYNIFVLVGQSNMAAKEASPALTLTAVDGVLMLGNSLVGQNDASTTWLSVGPSVLNPAIASVLNSGQTATIDAAAQAALAAGAANLGESLGLVAVNTLRQAWLRRSQAVTLPKKIVVLNCAVSGKTIAQLSKGASPNLYNRIPTAVAAAVSAINAASPGATIKLAGIIHNQGEDDYGAATSKAAFKASTQQFYADIVADIAVALFSQTRLPPFVMVQTAGWGTTDLTSLAIGTAQVELAAEVAGMFLAQSRQNVSEKGIHMDPNGARWLGTKVGAVLDRILLRGIGWKPLQPIDVRYRRNEILIGHHVPEPPVQIASVLVTNVATNYTAKGYTVTDSVGAVTINAVEVVADTVIRLTCARALTGPVTVSIGRRQTHQGRTNICDSDAGWTPYNYLYTAGNGQYVDANIAGLVGNPYPQNNWSVCGDFVASAVN